MAFGVWCSSDRLNLVEFWCVSRGPAPAVLYRRCFRYVSQWIWTDQEPAEHKEHFDWFVFVISLWQCDSWHKCLCLHVSVHQVLLSLWGTNVTAKLLKPDAHPQTHINVTKCPYKNSKSWNVLHFGDFFGWSSWEKLMHDLN